MSESEKILKSVDANLRLEGMRLTSAEKQTIMDCLTGKSSFDREIKKLSAHYQGVAAQVVGIYQVVQAQLQIQTSTN